MSIATAPLRIDRIISSVMSFGARAPGTRADPITTSASRTRCSSVSRSDISVMIRPLWIWSMNRSRSRFVSTTITSASMPAPIHAAFDPAIPAPTTHPAPQTPAAPLLLLQETRGDVGRHPARDLAHRRKQGQAAVGQLHGLVRDRRDLPLGQRLRELPAGRQVEVGEQDLALAQVLELRRDRLLHLHDHVGARPDLGRGSDDLGTGALVTLLRDARAGARAVLDEDLVPRRGELASALGRQRDAVLVVLDLSGDPDDHGLALPTSGMREAYPTRRRRRSCLRPTRPRTRARCPTRPTTWYAMLTSPLR